MNSCKFLSFEIKAAILLIMIALSSTYTASLRILDEALIPPTTSIATPDASVVAPGVGATTGTAPATTGTGATSPMGAAVAGAGASTIGAATGVGVGTGVGAGAATGVGVGTGVGAGATGVGAGATGVGAGAGVETPDNSLTFFMHDILGGTNPSAIAVTGIVANPAVGGQVPFAKPNGAVLPQNNGGQGNNGNNGIMNNNNLPFLTGLSGTRPNLIANNNNGNNIIGGGGGFPALNMGQFQSGTTFQKLMFGTMTVFDDELTEGHDLGSGSVGKAQGFYIASSEDGLSQTMAFNAMFASGSFVDSLSFFGVHRPAVSESHLAIMGGTGKYVNAKGFAIVKTLPAGSNTQQNTDGLETVLQFNVYLAY